MPARVMIARFPFCNVENPDLTDWLVKTVLEMKSDPRVGDILHMKVDDTPITMGRNRACKFALEKGCDLLLMLDSDIKPDVPEPGARPFWRSSFDFMLQHNGPCCVAAPYCGMPPHENVFIFHWMKKQTDNPNADLSLEQYTREQATKMAGIQEAAALPTGVFLMDMRALKFIGLPWFDYEYTDQYQTEKATTEDVYFTRNLSLAGVPQYCNWDAWAGHHKRKLVGKPKPLTVESVRDQFREAIASGRSSHEKLIDVAGPERPGPIRAGSARSAQPIPPMNICRISGATTAHTTAPARSCG